MVQRIARALRCSRGTRFGYFRKVESARIGTAEPAGCLNISKSRHWNLGALAKFTFWKLERNMPQAPSERAREIRIALSVALGLAASCFGLAVLAANFINK
jgi:hypothetical protein